MKLSPIEIINTTQPRGWVVLFVQTYHKPSMNAVLEVIKEEKDNYFSSSYIKMEKQELL